MLARNSLFACVAASAESRAACSAASACLRSSTRPDLVADAPHERQQLAVLGLDATREELEHGHGAPAALDRQRHDAADLDALGNAGDVAVGVLAQVSIQAGSPDWKTLPGSPSPFWNSTGWVTTRGAAVSSLPATL